MAWTSKALFEMARRRDELARHRARSRRLESIAALWAERAGITRDQAAVGHNPEAPIPAVLLGLRIGSCQLEIPSVVAGLRATATLSHDTMTGKGLRLVIRPSKPFADVAWEASPAILRHIRHVEPSDGRRCLFDHVLINQLYQDNYLEPTLVGHADLVELGDHSAASTRWAAHVLGAFNDADRWRGSLARAQVSLEVCSSESRKSGLAALGQDPRLGRVRRLAEWASWRRDEVTPDLGRLMRVDLEFTYPVTGLHAETYLLNHLCRLLHLYSGARSTLCGLWNSELTTGRLLDLGRPLYSERRRLVDGAVFLGPFLREVAPGWDSLSEDDKTAVRIGMDGLTAMSSDLEPAVGAGAMSLEFLAEAFLPKANTRYELTKAQREEILAGLRALATHAAPGTPWEQDLHRLESRLFQVPATDRIGELLEEFKVKTNAAELKAYAEVRNPVTHGRPRKATAQEKAHVTQLQLHAGGSVLLRKVGYTGRVQDGRGAQPVAPRPGSRVK